MNYGSRGCLAGHLVISPHKYEIKRQWQSWTCSLQGKSVLICSARSLCLSQCHCQHFHWGWLGRPFALLQMVAVSLASILLPHHFTITWPPHPPAHLLQIPSSALQYIHLEQLFPATSSTVLSHPCILLFLACYDTLTPWSSSLPVLLFWLPGLTACLFLIHVLINDTVHVAFITPIWSTSCTFESTNGCCNSHSYRNN